MLSFIHTHSEKILTGVYVDSYAKVKLIGLTTGAMILSAISMPPCQKLHIARPGRGPSISPATAAAMLRFLSLERALIEMKLWTIDFYCACVLGCIPTATVHFTIAMNVGWVRPGCWKNEPHPKFIARNLTVYYQSQIRPLPAKQIGVNFVSLYQA